MKKIALGLVLSLLILLPVFAQEWAGIGVQTQRIGNKIYALHVFDNSPAQKAGLQATSEIVSVDNVKYKNIGDLTNAIRGIAGSNVQLAVKIDGQNKIFNITREKITLPEDKEFNMYWGQIAPYDFVNASYQIYGCNKYGNRVNNEIKEWNHWHARRSVFLNAYSMCKTYSKNEQQACLTKLVDRELTKIARDKEATALQEYCQKRPKAHYGLPAYDQRCDGSYEVWTQRYCAAKREADRRAANMAAGFSNTARAMQGLSLDCSSGQGASNKTYDPICDGDYQQFVQRQQLYLQQQQIQTQREAVDVMRQQMYMPQQHDVNVNIRRY